MMGKARNTFIIAMCLGGALIFNVSAMTPNPILSRGKTVYTSSGSEPRLNDNKYGSGWSVSNNSWIAINIGANYSKIFVNWNVPNTDWFDTTTSLKTCGNGDNGPNDYTIQKSSNSTNGSDGTWSTVLTITGNKTTARGHLIDFSSANFVKMNITKGAGSIDEFEVFDMSNNGTDIWFFPGTSISKMTYKSNPPAQDFADVVTAAHPGFNPVMIRGGIGCILSVFLSTYISFYLDMTRGVKYWAIEMGTNDAYNNGTSGLAAFTKNMQIVIDSCKAAGIQPIIARLISTNPAKAGWQVNPAYETTIDSLTKVNKLIAGPDLYTYFLNHPEEHSSDDGIHPSPTGAASIQRLWAQKMDSLYTVTSAIKSETELIKVKSARNLSISSIRGQNEIHALRAGSLRIFSVNGLEIKSLKIPASGSYLLPPLKGLCIVRFLSNDNTKETLPVIPQ